MYSDKILRYINTPKYWYLSQNPELLLHKINPLSDSHFTLYQILGMDNMDVKSYLLCQENVLSTLCIKGITLVFIMIGTGSKINYYYGLVENTNEKTSKDISLCTFESIFECAFGGNFANVALKKLNQEEKYFVIEVVNNMNYASILEGVPGKFNETSTILGADSFYTVSKNDQFALLQLALPLSLEEIIDYEDNVIGIQNFILPFTNRFVTRQQSNGRNRSFLVNSGKSSSVTNIYSNTETRKEKKTTGDNEQQNIIFPSFSNNTSEVEQEQFPLLDDDFVINNLERSRGLVKSKNCLSSLNNSVSQTETNNLNCSTTTTIACPDMAAKAWLHYIETVIGERIDYGKGVGMFAGTALLLSNEQHIQYKLQASYQKLFQCKSCNRIPLCSTNMTKNDKRLLCMRNLNVPYYQRINDSLFGEEERKAGALFSKLIYPQKAIGGTILSTKELSSLFAVSQNAFT